MKFPAPLGSLVLSLALWTPVGFAAPMSVLQDAQGRVLNWAPLSLGSDLADQLIEENLKGKTPSEIEELIPVVGVVDTGFDAATWKDRFHNSVLNEKGFEGAGSENEDQEGHGTSVASIIAGNHIGATKFAKIISHRITTLTEGGNVEDGIRLDQAVLKACQSSGLVNYSWSGALEEESFWPAEFEPWLVKARDMGCLVIQSAGNAAKRSILPNRDPSNPVLRVEANNFFGQRSSFSSFGSVQAPGEALWAFIPPTSSMLTETKQGLANSQKDERERIGEMDGRPLLKVNGTSFAAPLVAATASQVLLALKSRNLVPENPLQRLQLLRILVQTPKELNPVQSVTAALQLSADQLQNLISANVYQREKIFESGFDAFCQQPKTEFVVSDARLKFHLCKRKPQDTLALFHYYLEKGWKELAWTVLPAVGPSQDALVVQEVSRLMQEAQNPINMDKLSSITEIASLLSLEKLVPSIDQLKLWIDAHKFELSFFLGGIGAEVFSRFLRSLGDKHYELSSHLRLDLETWEDELKKMIPDPRLSRRLREDLALSIPSGSQILKSGPDRSGRIGEVAREVRSIPRSYAGYPGKPEDENGEKIRARISYLHSRISSGFASGITQQNYIYFPLLGAADGILSSQEFLNILEITDLENTNFEMLDFLIMKLILSEQFTTITSDKSHEGYVRLDKFITSLVERYEACIEKGKVSIRGNPLLSLIADDFITRIGTQIDPEVLGRVPQLARIFNESSVTNQTLQLFRNYTKDLGKWSPTDYPVWKGAAAIRLANALQDIHEAGIKLPEMELKKIFDELASDWTTRLAEIDRKVEGRTKLLEKLVHSCRELGSCVSLLEKEIEETNYQTNSPTDLNTLDSSMNIERLLSKLRLESVDHKLALGIITDRSWVEDSQAAVNKLIEALRSKGLEANVVDELLNFANRLSQWQPSAESLKTIKDADALWEELMSEPNETEK